MGNLCGSDVDVSTECAKDEDDAGDVEQWAKQIVDPRTTSEMIVASWNMAGVNANA